MKILCTGGTNAEQIVFKKRTFNLLSLSHQLSLHLTISEGDWVFEALRIACDIDQIVLVISFMLQIEQ